MTLNNINKQIVHLKKVSTINIVNTQAYYSDCSNSGYRHCSAIITAVMLNADNEVVGHITYNFEDYSDSEFETRYDEGIIINDENNNTVYSDGINYGSIKDNTEVAIEFIEKITSFIGWEYDSVSTLIDDVFYDSIVNELSNQ